ncbi:hypothetical protein FKM82_026135 [Ascaphus truei]
MALIGLQSHNPLHKWPRLPRRTHVECLQENPRPVQPATTLKTVKIQLPTPLSVHPGEKKSLVFKWVEPKAERSKEGFAGCDRTSLCQTRLPPMARS